MIRNISISKRISLFLIALVILMIAMTFGFYHSASLISNMGASTARDMMYHSQQDRIRDITHSTALGLANMTKGLDDEAQLQIIRQFVMEARFEEDLSGYFFVYSGTINLIHPTVPRLEGTDLGKTADKDGVFYVQELAANAAKGGGFVHFIFPKPNQGDQPKLAYSENIPGTKYWIGTGVYIDNVQVAETAIINKMTDIKNQNVLILIACVAGVLIIIGIPMAYILVTSISRPLNRATRIADEIAIGHLDATIIPEGKDEITKLENAFSRMNDNLSRTMAQLRISSENVATSAGEINQGNIALSERTEKQAGAIEETAGALEKITGSVKQNADNAKEADQLSQKAVTMAKNGGQTLQRTIEAMQAVTESSKKINDIISVVNSIAFQTNLLALNAAVEAARAGEAGRGFAVVATEVRGLAGRSSGAANEIQALITDSVNKIEQSNQLVAQSGTILNEIIDSVQAVAVTIQEITTASNEQAIGIEEINNSVSQLDQAVQQNATLVEEVSSASENLNLSAATALDQVKQFRTQENTLALSATAPPGLEYKKTIHTHHEQDEEIEEEF